MAARLAVAVVVVVALLCLLLPASSEWVDYPSGMRCCSDIPEERCDPESPSASRACRDVCHYGGCSRGGQCEYLGPGIGRGCHCNC